MRKVKAKVGRPPKKPKDRLSHRVTVRLNPAQFAELNRLAEKAGLSISSYLSQFIGGKQ